MPAICINNDIIVVITNISFVKSFTSFISSDMVFKLGGLSGNKMSFKVVDDTEDNEIIGLYLSNMFVGNVEARVLSEIMYEIQAVLHRRGLDKKRKPDDYV